MPHWTASCLPRADEGIEASPNEHATLATLRRRSLHPGVLRDASGGVRIRAEYTLPTYAVDRQRIGAALVGDSQCPNQRLQDVAGRANPTAIHKSFRSPPVVNKTRVSSGLNEKPSI
jgi:hypothetical protein